MRCPKCATEVDVGGVKYDLRHGCPACGWTHSDPDAIRASHTDDDLTVSPGQWVICLALSIPFVLGPYIVIRALRPAWATPGFLAFYYWLGWVAYVLAAIVLIPDRKPYPIFALRYRLFGPYWISWTALAEGVLAFVLTPALLVFGALTGGPRYVILARRARAKSRQLREESEQRAAREK